MTTTFVLSNIYIFKGISQIQNSEHAAMTFIITVLEIISSISPYTGKNKCIVQHIRTCKTDHCLE